MNISGKSRWVCVECPDRGEWFTCGKVYTRIEEEMQDDTGYWWVLEPNDISPKLKFVELKFDDYLTQAELCL